MNHKKFNFVNTKIFTLCFSLSKRPVYFLNPYILLAAQFETLQQTLWRLTSMCEKVHIWERKKLFCSSYQQKDFHLTITFFWFATGGGGIIDVNFMFLIGFTHKWKHNASKISFNFLYTVCNAIWGLTPNTMKSEVRVWDHVSPYWYQIV